MSLQKLIKQNTTALTVLTILLFPLITIAAEVNFPVPAYTPDELAKVREWETTWSGKKIDKTNIDGVAEFMPESYVGIYKDPEKWGGPPEGLSFTIVPYKQIIETKGMIEATKKYSPIVKTNEKGEIINTTELAGFPFPSPKTGLEIAYNMDFQTRGDTYSMNWRGPVIDPKARTDRMSDQEFIEMYFIHRVEVDPKPAILKNPKGFHKGQFLHVNLPAENNNTRFISMRFIDETKPYSSYMFFAQYRRIQRMSQAERTNALDGTDMIYDDGNMFDGNILSNNYTYKGKKELLLARHQDINNIKRISGQGIANGYTFERCNTYVVEAVNKDPDYIYSKRIWYIDPETYIIHWQEIYDELGRYWKCFMQPTQDFKMENGEMKNFMAANVLQDFQRTHSGHTTITTKKIGHKVSPRIFNLSNLQDTY